MLASNPSKRHFPILPSLAYARFGPYVATEPNAFTIAVQLICLTIVGQAAAIENLESIQDG